MTGRSRIAFVALGTVTLAASALALGTRGSGSAAAETAAAQPTLDRIVAPGRVEPISEEIEVGIEVAGRIVSLEVDEGDRVSAGQVIAVLANDDFAAAVMSAGAQLADARAELLRVRNGSRPAERREARAAVEQARAVLRQGETELERREALADDGIIAREELDRAGRDVDVARARLDEVVERLALVEAGPRAEEHARAEAAVARAEAAQRHAQVLLAKTQIRSPIDGVVLRRRVRAGESVSPEVPGTSLFTIADVSQLRVRVDVDENDVGALRLGAPAWVTAATFGDRRFPGRVVRIGQALGRKNVRTDQPRERVDTKILETLVELEPGTSLPVGLRVDATIQR